MNPWAMQGLADSRRAVLLEAAASSATSIRSSPAAAAPDRATGRGRVVRYFGELLIRTGTRLAGPGSAPGDVRARLATGGASDPVFDLC
jgi:hypothetical protein